MMSKADHSIRKPDDEGSLLPGLPKAASSLWAKNRSPFKSEPSATPSDFLGQAMRLPIWSKPAWEQDH